MLKTLTKPIASIVAGACFVTMTLTQAAMANEHLKNVIEAQERAEESVRDKYRNPYETLSFFGAEPNMTIVELAPSGGWYSEILGPYVAKEGKLIAGHFNMERENAPAYFTRAMAAYKERIADKERFGDIDIVPFDPPAKSRLGESGSADMVLSFRSVHGWKRDGVFGDVLKSVYDVLKPGGTFGIVGHRLPEDGDDSEFTGYVKQSWVIEMAEAAGLKLVESSEINANPNDPANHENGVWSLPPSLSVKDEALKERNRKIGESDRFTLKFVKAS
ncbi:methyltransferase [Alteromonas sediminis]|uniref:Methyltransferase n=1 Tax=Alteromonas sediminis TaxID=2259342 RepID=A0A3N5Y5I2_9ALTE|nr:class I SAM-dependent methyltransferase [Alteromonas sediminis]RPJ68346.1 methyltransferase [Alteromonas sediminis]